MGWRSIEEPDETVIVLRGLPATTPASYERFYRRRKVVTLGFLAFLFQRLISWSVALTLHLILAAVFLGLYVHITKEDDSLLFASLFRGNAGEEGKKLEAPEFEPAKEEPKKEPEPPQPEPPKPEPVPETKPEAVEKAPEKETPSPNPVPAAADAAAKPAAVGAGASATGKPSAPVNDAEVEKDPTAALRARRAGELDQLRKGSDKDIVVVRGQYDSVELVLGRLGIPHRVVDPERLPKLDLSGTKILLLNCHNLYGSYLFKEADTKGLEKLIGQLAAKVEDLQKRADNTKDPRALYRTRLELNQTDSYLGECRRRLEGLSYSGQVADVVGRFVRGGGYAFTSDWGLSILERGLPGYVKNGGNVGPKTVSIKPRPGKEKHALLEDVFYETGRGTTTYRKFLWEIDSASYLVKVEKPSAVETLVESAELPKCPAVAVVITPEAEGGARPGRVLHILSHFQKQATQQGDYALQAMLLNFMLDCVRPADRRAAVLPEIAVAPAVAAPAAPRAEFGGIHRDEKGRFTLAIPKGWTLTTTGDSANPVVLEKPGEGLRGSLSVSAPPDRVDRSFDWDPYVRALTSEMERQCDEVKVTRKMQAFSNGHPAYFVSMMFKKGDARWGLLQYAVVTPQATYTLAWTAPGDSFRECEPLFEQSSKAFTLPVRAE